MFDTVVSQVNLSTENLNSTVKEIQRITIELKDSAPESQADLYYRLANAADSLAMELTRNVTEYGDSTKGLIDLIIKRVENLNVKIQWDPDKNRFFYDGEGFMQYLRLAPDGPKSAECAYQLLESEFFKSNGDHLESLLNAIEQKREYLVSYPASERAAEIRIMLAIEYRDVSRLYLSNHNSDATRNYINLALQEILHVIESYPVTRESQTAETLRERIVEEFGEFVDIEN